MPSSGRDIPTVREAWREMVDADQTYLYTRARWRRVASDEAVDWDDPEVLAVTDQLEAAGHESNAAQDAFAATLERVTARENLRL